MTTHKLVINENGEQNTFFTLAQNTEKACEKVRRWLKDQGREAEIQTCAPKPAITIVETVAETHAQDDVLDARI
jgi:hypothetical protein